MLGAPNRTPYDLHFTLLGIPVRVHPFFWLITALLGFSGNQSDPVGILIWIGVVFLSILVHEMGHALTMRYFGHHPSVVLYGGGGLAMYQSTDSPWSSFGTSNYGRRESPWSSIIISAAGPAAGFILAGIVVIYLVAGSASTQIFGVSLGIGDPVANLRLSQFVGDMLLVNIFWGMVNLLPIYPLDGGQIARQISQMVSPYNGLRTSLWISLITAAGVGLLGFRFGIMLIGIMFAYFAIMNWQMLQSSGGGGFGGGGGGGYGGGGRPW